MFFPPLELALTDRQGIIRRGGNISRENHHKIGIRIVLLFRFAAYKFPKMAGEPSDSADGYGFYYLDSTSKSTFKPSAVSLKLPHNVRCYPSHEI